MADHLASHIPSLASSCNNQIPNPTTASASNGGASPTHCPVVDNSSSVLVGIPPPIDGGAIPTSNAQETRSTSVGSCQARTLDSSRHALVRPTVKQFQRQELGKVVLEFAVSMTTGLVISQHQGLTHLQASAIVLTLCVGFVTWWNGMLLHDIYPRVASALEYIGVGTILAAFFGLVISFLPPSLAWAGWLCCGLSCLPALLRLVLPRAVEEASSAGFVAPRAAVEGASSEARSVDLVLPRAVEEVSSAERLDEGIIQRDLLA